MGRKARCSRNVVLVLVPLIVAGCGGPSEVRRDIYAKFEDCVADWGDTALCQKLGEQERQDLAAANGGPSGTGARLGSTYIFGPSYDPYSRSVEHGGRTIAPSGNRAFTQLSAPPRASFARSPGKPGKVAGPGSVTRGVVGTSGARASASSST